MSYGILHTYLLDHIYDNNQLHRCKSSVWKYQSTHDGHISTIKPQIFTPP